MSSKGKFAIGVALTALGLTFLLFTPAAQADLYWTTTSGSMTAGSGVWDTSGFWATDSSGDDAGLWVASSVADFDANSSPTSTITIDTSVTAGGVTFDGSGYTVTGGVLNLVGGGVITVNQAATINSVIGGSVGLTVQGAAQLTLGGVETYSGTTTVSGGTLYLTGSTGGTILNSTAIVVNNGGTFYISNMNNTSSAPQARVTATTPVKVSGGTFSYLGDPNYSGTEIQQFGALTIAAGQNIVSVSRGSVSTSDAADIVFGSNTSSLASDLIYTPMSGAMVDFASTIHGQGGPGGSYSNAGYGVPTAPGDIIYFGTTSIGSGPASTNAPADWIVVNGHDFARWSGSHGMHQETTANTAIYNSVTQGGNACVVVVNTATQTLSANVTDNSLCVQLASAGTINLNGYTLNLENNGAGKPRWTITAASLSPALPITSPAAATRSPAARSPRALPEPTRSCWCGSTRTPPRSTP